MKPLVIDVGGTSAKVWSTDGTLIERIATGKDFTPDHLFSAVRELTRNLEYDSIALGYPGPVAAGQPTREPWNLGDGWRTAEYAAEFGVPVRIMNDAAMQALGSYSQGAMLFLGLGTSVGSALVIDGFVIPLELGSIPYSRRATLEDRLSKNGLHMNGKRIWRKTILETLPKLKYAFGVDTIVIGGGNAAEVKGSLPDFVVVGDNRNAYVGGVRLWEARDYKRVHWISSSALEDTSAKQ